MINRLFEISLFFFAHHLQIETVDLTQVDRERERERERGREDGGTEKEGRLDLGGGMYLRSPLPMIYMKETLTSLSSVREQEQCIICGDAIAPGHIRLNQRGCPGIYCQECAVAMAEFRARESGNLEMSYNSGELMCNVCNPQHPIKPGVLARVIPSPTYRRLQVREKI